jgi:hypothetical protein
MELSLQKYLRNGKTTEDLLIEYDIHSKRHSKYPNLILFKYGLSTPMSEQLSREARGIILDENNNWAVVCYSYSRFFNYGESFAAEIDWSSAKVKADGSLMQVQWYDGKWQVASSGTPDAGGNVQDFPLTFAELFWRTWETLRYNLPTNTNLCYAFELITPYNRVVCRYDQPRIVLHGVRDLVTLSELFPEPIAKECGWDVVKSYPLQTLEEVVNFVKEFNPLTDEGCVICDKNYQRLKVKSPQYIALSRMKDGMGTKHLIELVRIGEAPEFLSYFPEFTEEYLVVKEKYETLANTIANSFANFYQIPSQKDYALAIKHLPYSGILFQLRKDPKLLVKDLLREIRIEKLMDLLGN